MDLPWACVECGARQATDERCAGCGGLLVDLRMPEARESLRSADEERLRRHDQRLYAIAIPLGMVSASGLAVFSETFRSFSISFCLLGFFAQCLGISLGIHWMLKRARPLRPRHPYVLD